MDKTNTTNLRMMWDCEFYYRLLGGLINLNNSAAVMTLSTLIMRECTVFVKEMADYNPIIGDAISEEASKLFNASYPKMRDRIHYFLHKTLQL